MNRNTKKGFTIVELIIVIAVIGILAAVLIPTFSGLIRNSQEAKDTALVRNLNVLLKMDNTKHESMRSVVEALDKQGADITKLTAAITENRILWDSEADLFAYLNKGTDGKETISYIPDFDGTPLESKYKYWIVSDSTADVAGKDYSVYWRGEGRHELTVYTGFDCGKAKFDKIIYTSDKQQDVSLYINGGDLDVSAVKNGTQHLYGNVVNATIATGNDCLYVHGTIAKATVTAGKVVADGGLVMVAAAESGVTVVGQNGGIVAKTADAGTLPDTVKVSTDAEKSAYALEIGSREDLLAFRDMVNSGVSFAGMTAKLTADIDMTGYEWTEMVGTKENNFKGSFDGANHKIINLSNNGKKSTEVLENTTTGNKGSMFGLFGYISGKVTIENLDISVNAYMNSTEEKGNGWGAIAATAGKPINDETTIDLTVKNITVSGILSSGDKAGGLIGDASANSNSVITFENCTNKANVEGDRAAGIVACTQNLSKVTFKDCKNEGSITSSGTKYSVVAGISAQIPVGDNYKGRLSYENCVNKGELSAKTAYNLFTSVVLYKTVDGYAVTNGSASGALDIIKYRDTMIGGAYSDKTKIDWELVEKKFGLEGLFAGVEYGKDETYNAEYICSGYTFKYKTFEEAFEKLCVDSDHINLKVNTDISWNTSVYSGINTAGNPDKKIVSSFTLDLNGHKLTANAMIMNVNGAKVTIKNGTIEAGGGYNEKLFVLTNKSNLTLDNIVIDYEGNSIASVASNYTGTLNLTGTTKVTGYVYISGTTDTKLVLNDTTYVFSQDNGYIVINGKTATQGNSKQ